MVYTVNTPVARERQPFAAMLKTIFAMGKRMERDGCFIFGGGYEDYFVCRTKENNNDCFRSQPFDFTILHFTT